MKLIRILKKFIPNEGKAALKRLIFPGQVSPLAITFRGIYTARSHIEEKKQGYANNDWLMVNKNLALEKFHTIINSSYSPESLSVVYNLMTLLTSTLLVKKERISILDFGGGFGINYFDCLYSVKRQKNIDYFLTDSSELMQVFIQEMPKFVNLNLVKDLSKSEQKFDLIYCGSVLQYIDDYKALLLQFMQKSNEYVFLTNNFMGAAVTFATEQVNMGETTTAYWILNKKEVIQLFADYSFELIYESQNYQPLHNMHNFPQELRVDWSTNLLFRKG